MHQFFTLAAARDLGPIATYLCLDQVVGCLRFCCSHSHRLLDVLHHRLKLTMVFEYCEQVSRITQICVMCVKESSKQRQVSLSLMAYKGFETVF